MGWAGSGEAEGSDQAGVREVGLSDLGKAPPDLGQMNESFLCCSYHFPSFSACSRPSRGATAAEEAAILVQSQIQWAEPGCGIRIHLAGSTPENLDSSSSLTFCFLYRAREAGTPAPRTAARGGSICEQSSEP